MGFWHTGYAEFHEPSGLHGDDYTPPPPTRYGCEHCTQSFAALEDLRRHRFEQHRQRQPLLMIRGQAVGALPIRVLMALNASDVLIEDAHHCTVDGLAMKPSELGAQLAAMQRECVDIELKNGTVTSRHVLDFRIVDADHLAGVETAFTRMARDRELTLDAVSRFIQDCQSFSTAMPYCDGICHYLYGVMSKECSPDSGLAPGGYVARYNQAIDGLNGFERPLARSIRALIAFHFNRFGEAELLAPAGGLRHAAGAFVNLLSGMPWHYESAFTPKPGGAVEDLLTDQETTELLIDTSRGVIELKAASDQLLARLERMPRGYDHLKRTLLAAEALAAQDEGTSWNVARRLARGLAAQTATRAWGETMLQRLKTS